MSAFKLKRYVLTKFPIIQIHSEITAIAAKPGPSNLGRNISESSNQDQDENTYIMDISKPVGDACREDGTLKDAKEMDWPNSPTEHNRAIIEEMFPEDTSGLERPPSSRLESDDEVLLKKKVRYKAKLFSLDTYRIIHYLSSKRLGTTDRFKLLLQTLMSRC